METEEFAFDFTYKVSKYFLPVKRFLVDGEVHLWTLVKHLRTPDQIVNFYETASSDKLCWLPLNDKRDDLMKRPEKPLLKKLNELKKREKIQTYESYE